ncbi:APC family permease [Spiroplasma cantharicola]|uniref:Amino acid permease n=1 Tax=Spiroplasma cantharicola TaxID=362837 RepID=A0A0M4JKI9_9MOLU|nr:APC family permease [Spiroplasma cantharicola]ALD66899.1 amino acid permease [Spiroplasma cantharicola]
MIKVNKANKAKNKSFEFLTIFSMVFGIVVGSGIYLKNKVEAGGVLHEAGRNPWLALTVWLFIGVLCSLVMLTFIEAASATKNDGHSTAQSWANKFINRRTASLFSILYICMYLPILAGLGALFTVKTVFSGINTFYFAMNEESLILKIGKVQWMSLELFFSTIVLIGFSLMNIFTHKPSKFIQSIFTIVKFLPLITIVIGGFSLFIINPKGNNSFNPSTGYEPWQVNTFFGTMIPILFAFDGFIYAATLQKDCEHKEVVAPAMLSAIIAVTFFYIIITISIFFGASDGDVFKLFDNLFKKSPWVALLFKLIIAGTILTTVNGYTTLIPKTVQSGVQEKFIYSKEGKDNISYVKSGFIGMAITISIYVLFLTISIAIDWNSPEINYFLVADYSSNSTVMFGFIVYLILMIYVLHNRRTKKVETLKVKGGFVIGIITCTILSIIMGYAYYNFMIGKFLSNDFKTMIDPILLIFFALVLAIVWIVNECLISKNNIDNNDFILRIKPNNWFKYNKELEIKKFKSKTNVK